MPSPYIIIEVEKVMKRTKRSCFNSFGNKWSFIGYYKYTSSSWYRTGPISSSTRLHSKNFFESEFWKLFFATGSRVSTSSPHEYKSNVPIVPHSELYSIDIAQFASASYRTQTIFQNHRISPSHRLCPSLTSESLS